ncbi:MAG: LruC domain-containing protein, partial [Candidatus Cloacimonadaceae bacterium]|nr:LruC domain-containing protein [Candidatus Cloacimonadaceae bacterium]
MKHKILLVLTLLLIGLVLISCDRRTADGAEFVPIQDLVISDGFDFATTKDIDIELSVVASNSQPVAGVVFSIFNDDPAQGGDLIARGVTNADGIYRTVKSLSNIYRHVYVQGNFETLQVPVVNGRIRHTYSDYRKVTAGDFSKPQGAKNYQYLPWLSYNADGLPSPMTTEIVPSGLVTRLNQLLPEYQSLPLRHPVFFSPGLRTLVKVDEDVELFLTFVNEGAGFRNAVGFYVYPQGTVINTKADLGPLTIVFPNASKVGGGGSLNMSDTVYLGEIPGGMMVGWFLIANGFVTGSQVNTNRQHYYSDNQLNPESDPSLRQHVIQAFDWETQSIILAFEDQNREGTTDNDFNDIIFRIRATPFSSIDVTDLPPINPHEDRDGDGVPDDWDDYPDDPDLAFNNYTPSENTWGSLAFEDLWPRTGDYDFNDMVIDYNINQITNSQNKVVIVQNRYKLVANGARHKNGFAVEFPIHSSLIQSYSGSHPALLTYETDSPRAIFRLFDNAFYLIPQQPGNNFINTTPGLSYINPVEFTLDFRLSVPQYMSSFNYQAPFNPFAFLNTDRTKEVHL